MSGHPLRNGNAFAYPDAIFPSVDSPFPGLPVSPLDKIAKLESEYQRHAARVSAESQANASDKKPIQGLRDVDSLFRWAREALDFAESQPGLDQDLLDTAMDVVKLIADSNASKFAGAANYIVGIWSLFGLFGNSIDHSTALSKFVASARMGFSRALYRIGASYETAGDDETSLAYFEHGVKRGDAACYYRMAIAYLRGQLGKDLDAKKGVEYLERASLTSDPDCAQAPYIYGLVQLGELNVVNTDKSTISINREAGIMALERSAWLGFGPALLRMGKAWQGGEKGYDAAVALRYFQLASRQDQYVVFKDKKETGSLLGVPEVEISKWMVCGYQDLFSKNEEWAFNFALIAAEQANATGEFAVGYFYEIGIYVTADLPTAISWYKKSSARGCEEATARLKALEGDANSGTKVGLERRLTRVDHERSVSIKGRGNVKQSRKLTSSPLLDTPEYTRVYDSPPQNRNKSPERRMPSDLNNTPSSLYAQTPVSTEQPSPARNLFNQLQTEQANHPSLQPDRRESSADTSQPETFWMDDERSASSPNRASWSPANASTPPAKDQFGRPLSWARKSNQYPMNMGAPRTRSLSPRKGHQHSSSVIVESSAGMGSLVSPRKVSSPLTSPVRSPARSPVVTSALYAADAPLPARTPSPLKLAASLAETTSEVAALDIRDSTQPQLEAVTPSEDRSPSAKLNSQSTPKADTSDAADSDASRSPKAVAKLVSAKVRRSFRTVSGTLLPRMAGLPEEKAGSEIPDHVGPTATRTLVDPEEELEMDSDPSPQPEQADTALFSVVPLRVKKSSELLKKHSFSHLDASFTSNASDAGEEPAKDSNRSIPGTSPSSKGISLGSANLQSPGMRLKAGGMQTDPFDGRHTVRSSSSQPALHEHEGAGDSRLHHSESQPALGKEAEELASPSDTTRGSESTTPVATPLSARSRYYNERSSQRRQSMLSDGNRSLSPRNRISPTPSQGSPGSAYSRAHEWMGNSSQHSSPSSSPKAGHRNSQLYSESINTASTVGGSLFSRASTMSSTTSSALTISSGAPSVATAPRQEPETVKKAASMPVPDLRVALTFDEMGVPVAKEEKDCVIM